MLRLILIVVSSIAIALGINWGLSFLIPNISYLLTTSTLSVGLFLLIMKVLPNMNMILNLSDFLEKPISWVPIAFCFFVALPLAIYYSPNQSVKSVSLIREPSDKDSDLNQIEPISDISHYPEEKPSQQLDYTPDKPLPKVKYVNAPNIKGIITNSRDGKGVKGASIIIEKDTFETVSSGKFTVPSRKVNSMGVKIKIEKEGFFSWSDFYEVGDLSKEFKVNLKPKVRILIGDFEYKQADSSSEKYQTSIPALMKNAFIDCPEMEVVARGDKLEQISSEIDLNKSRKDLFDPNEIVETGKAVGANFIITGSVRNENGQLFVDAELIDMKKSVTSQQVNMRLGEQELNEKIPKLASNLVGKEALVNIHTITQVQKYNPRLISLQGSNSCIPEGWHIWISVQPAGVDKHFPQGFATVDGNSWNVSNTYLGNEQDRGLMFHIYAILADPHAHQIFKNYIDSKRFNGLELPKGAKVCDSKGKRRP